jgi:hypothetical protein
MAPPRYNGLTEIHTRKKGNKRRKQEELLQSRGKQKNATTSPDRAAGENIAAAVPINSQRKRRNDRDTPAAKAARVGGGSSVEESKVQQHGETAPRETPNSTKAAATEDALEAPPEAPEAPATTETIVKLLSNLWSGNQTTIEQALTDLADLCHDDTTCTFQANELEIRRLGGHMAIVQVLKKQVDAVLIQEEGIRALCNCTYPALAEVLVGDIGGLEVILAGMRKHPKNINIQGAGCGAIANLLHETKRNAERLKESDGIASVISAMKAHPENEIVQSSSCGALVNMCEWAEYRPLVLAAGGAVTIANVMEKYSDTPRVFEVSQDAMQRLVKRD